MAKRLVIEPIFSLQGNIYIPLVDFWDIFFAEARLITDLQVPENPSHDRGDIDVGKGWQWSSKRTSFVFQKVLLDDVKIGSKVAE